MPNTPTDPTWPNSLAPSDTLHGQLQRGRGLAFLRALEMRRQRLHPLLLDCITRDQRYDQQGKARDDIYAELALRSGFDLAPALEYIRGFEPVDGGSRTALAIETLAIPDCERFVATCARECLRDCPTVTIGHAPLDAPLVREGQEESARIPAWVDEDVRTESRARLAAGR